MAALQIACAAVLVIVATAQDHTSQALHGRCQQVLSQFSIAQHSHLELAALCRANVPQTVCADGFNSLGEKPWSSSNIDETCTMWLKDYEARILRVNGQLLDNATVSIPDVVKNVSDTVNGKTQNTTNVAESAMDKISNFSTQINEAVSNSVKSTSELKESMSRQIHEVANAAKETLDDAEKNLDAELVSKVDLQQEEWVAKSRGPLTFVIAGLVALLLLAGGEFAVRRAGSRSADGRTAVGEAGLL